MHKGDFVACTAPAGVAVALDVQGELARELTTPARLGSLRRFFGSAASVPAQGVTASLHTHRARRHTLIFEFAAPTHAAPGFRC